MPRENYYLPSRKLVNQADAALTATPHVPRSKFVGSWTRKTALDAGILYPILVDEVLPGDHLSYDVTAYVRMSTPLFPLFDNQRIDTHFFFVPARLLWDNWQRFMGEQDDPSDDIEDLEIPRVEYDETDGTVGSIFDHMGLPTEGQLAPAPEVLCVNALPFRAYNLIYNEWFRDQNLIGKVSTNVTSDGPDDPGDYTLLRRAKFHDYFTSALPWLQKFTGPTIPLGGLAPVTGIGIRDFAGAPSAALDWFATSGNENYQAVVANQAAFIPALLSVGIKVDPADNQPQIFADLATASGVTISDLRQAVLVQELLERDARGGTRYIEINKHHFGVNSPDARLQRPEYIGGGQTPLMITPIAQTVPTATEPLGALGAAGSAAGQHKASYAATEHGYIIGLLSIRTELSYQQGVSRMWRRQNRYDFYWPTLAGLSEQAITRGEIFATGDTTNDLAVWAYQERWQEYRTRTSEVTGIMRSQAPGTLDAWHLAQSFSVAPSLNQAFIEDTPPMDRVLAAGALAQGQQYLADIMYHRTAIRPIPTYGIPASLTRF